MLRSITRIFTSPSFSAKKTRQDSTQEDVVKQEEQQRTNRYKRKWMKPWSFKSPKQDEHLEDSIDTIVNTEDAQDVDVDEHVSDSMQEDDVEKTVESVNTADKDETSTPEPIPKRKRILSRTVVKRINNSIIFPYREVWDNSLTADVNVGNLLISGGMDNRGLIPAKIFSGDTLIRDYGNCGDDGNDGDMVQQDNHDHKDNQNHQEKPAVLRVFLKIRNKTYHKQVGIKYTPNKWKTQHTVPAKYITAINTDYDLFSVDIPIQFTSYLWHIDFAAFCQYDFGGEVEECWDNRNGNNWSVSVGMQILWRSFLNGSGVKLSGPEFEVDYNADDGGGDGVAGVTAGNGRVVDGVDAKVDKWKKNAKNAQTKPWLAKSC